MPEREIIILPVVARDERKRAERNAKAREARRRRKDEMIAEHRRYGQRMIVFGFDPPAMWDTPDGWTGANDNRKGPGPCLS